MNTYSSQASRSPQVAPSRRENRAGGFTLIELILVMAILTIAISFTAPALANFFRGRALDSEARRLLALTRQAQSRAVSEGMPMQLWLDAEQGKFGLEAEPSYEAEDARAVEFTFGDDIEIEVLKESSRRRLSRDLVTRSPVISFSEEAAPNPRANLPLIRFLADGTVADTSPEGLRLNGRDGFSISLVRSRSGLNYEIETRNR